MGLMTGYYPDPTGESEVEQMFRIVYEDGEEEEGNIDIFNDWSHWDQVQAMRLNAGDVWKYNSYTTIYCTAK